MFKDFISSLRPRQWYKNLVIFLPLIFSGNLFVPHLFILSSLGFIALSLTSSANYLVNDIVDRKKDQKNKEKSSRPIAAGRISPLLASIYFVFLLGSAFILGGLLQAAFLAILVALVVLGTLYTFIFKNEPFLDVIIISVNFVLRAVSGAVLIGVVASPWLILCPFFLALFLAVGKRKAEADHLGIEGKKHRKTLTSYTPEMTASLMNISTALFIMSYSLYSILSVQRHSMLLTLPFMLYVVFRYRMLVEATSVIARHPEQLVHDTRSMIGLIAWSLMVIAVMYFSGATLL